MKVFAALAAAATAFDFQTLMMMQSMQQGNGGDMFANPLFVLSMLNDEKKETTTDKKNTFDSLLPFLLMGNGNGLGNMGNMLPLLMMQEDSSEDNELLMWMLFSGMGATGNMGVTPLFPGVDSTNTNMLADPNLAALILGRK